MKNFIISFDIPKEMIALRVKVFRELRRMNAKMIHESLWESPLLQNLTDIALKIKQHGGRSRILEEKFVF
jgi:hypothetical protein